MGSYNLQAIEVVIINIDQVIHKKSMFSLISGELILTNLNLVWKTKNLIRKTTQQYPLHSIRVFNGKAQVMSEKKTGENPRLTIFFKNDQVTFQFINKREYVVKKLANSINHAVTGSTENIYELKSNAIPGVAKVAEVLKGTVDVFKDAFTVKDEKQHVNISKKVDKKCSSCSAPISGIEGQVAHCEYCDTAQQL